jgi:predicted RNA-binding protein YlqC (UPF0109 family)
MTSTIDEQFVLYVVKSVVGNPDAVQIKRTIDDKGILLELTVDPDDLGRVIGKRGATAQSLRTLLRALGTKNDARYNLKIIDNGPERPPRDDNQSDEPQRSKPEAEPKAEPKAELKAEEPQENKEIPEEADTADDLADDDTSSVVSKTRKELEEFDDLDL